VVDIKVRPKCFFEVIEFFFLTFTVDIQHYGDIQKTVATSVICSCNKHPPSTTAGRRGKFPHGRALPPWGIPFDMEEEIWKNLKLHIQHVLQDKNFVGEDPFHSGY
jgi:hypothetical protein